MTNSFSSRRLARRQTRAELRLPLPRTAPPASSCSHWRPVVRALQSLFLLLALFIGQSPGHAQELQLAEQQLVLSLASQVLWTTTTKKQVSHPLGTQTLFIERQENKHAPRQRRARVFQYDYSTGAARVLLIDLAERSVVREQAIASVHLPLSDEEIAFAQTLLAQDDALLSALHQEQLLRQTSPFTTVDELDAKASIYEPLDSHDPCATSRCALLSLFDTSSTVFSTEPLINLSHQLVTQLQRR